MFKGHVVVVTGASSGIGLAIAQRFVEKGAVAVALGRTQGKLKRAAEAIGENYVPLVCDVSKEEQVAAASNFVRERYGKADALINNAGRARHRFTPENFAVEDYDFHYNVLLKGPMLMVKHFLPLLRQSSSPCIVNISSLGSLVDLRYDSSDFLYTTAKAALNRYNRHLVRSYWGIRSNLVIPGPIDTPLSRFKPPEVGERFNAKFAKSIPVGRMGQPEDIANCVLFLCSKEASFINGAEIVIDGGIGLQLPEWFTNYSFDEILAGLRERGVDAGEETHE